MPGRPAFGKLRQENHNLETSCVYINPVKKELSFFFFNNSSFNL